MKESGDFYSVQYQYLFIEKYKNALETKNGYQELLLYPPPLNFIIIPLLIFTPSPETMKKTSEVMSHIYFWLENVFLILGFLIYFLLLTPFIYFRLLFSIISKIPGIKQKIFYSLCWLIFGILYLIYNCLIDICIFINILCL